MPCLFLRNVPTGTVFDPTLTEWLYKDIATTLGIPEEWIQVHVEFGEYFLLKPNAKLVRAKDVHVFVEWHERPFGDHQAIATAIHSFLTRHNLESDITFRDSPPGTFFVNGKLMGKPPQDTEEL